MKKSIKQMIKLFNKQFDLKNIPFYIFFDVFNIVAAILIVNLYESEVEIWAVSYFFIFLLFCLAVFLKQYDKEYLSGLYQYKQNEEILEWIVMFCAMLFPGWLTGSAFLPFLESVFEGVVFPPGDMTVYTKTVLPFMLLYPLIFGLAPFIKANKKQLEKSVPLTKSRKVFLKTIPNWIIFIFSAYLLVFYFDILTGAFESDKIESMDFVGRAAVWGISMAALLIIYIPARMHFFFDSFGNRQNKISLIITVVIISIYSMTGINLF